MEKRSIYCNKATLSVNAHEAIIIFDKTEPSFDENYNIINNETVESTMVFMSPQQAKSVLKIFTNLISEYENKFGEIITDESIKKI